MICILLSYPALWISIYHDLSLDECTTAQIDWINLIKLFIKHLIRKMTNWPTSWKVIFGDHTNTTQQIISPEWEIKALPKSTENRFSGAKRMRRKFAVYSYFKINKFKHAFQCYCPQNFSILLAIHLSLKEKEKLKSVLSISFSKQNLFKSQKATQCFPIDRKKRRGKGTERKKVCAINWDYK